MTLPRSRSPERDREGMWCVDDISGEQPFYTMDGDLAQRYVKWLEDGGWQGVRLQQFTAGEWLEITK